MFTVPETVAPLVGDVMVQESVVAVTQAWDALQVWPVGQVPQVPVQPSVPQVLLVQFGVQTPLLLTVTTGALEQFVLD